jgi:hypothetical protein
MSDEKLERVLRTVEPGRRAALKKMVLAAAFTVPMIASFSVTNLAASGIGSGPPTTTSGLMTVTVTDITTTTTTTTSVTTTTP